MGTLYFILKNSIVTLVIVCLLQITIGGSSVEDRLMSFVRNSLAPQFLDVKTKYITKKKKIDPKDLAELKKKVFESSALKGAKKSVKEMFLKEMTEVIESSRAKKENSDNKE